MRVERRERRGIDAHEPAVADYISGERGRTAFHVMPASAEVTASYRIAACLTSRRCPQWVKRSFELGSRESRHPSNSDPLDSH